MDKYLIAGILLLLAGLVHLAVPLYFTMTGLVLCLLGAGFLLLRWLQKRNHCTFSDILKALMAASVTALMVFMSLIAAYGSASDWDSARTADYAIVLGCQVQTDNQPSAALSSRISLAAELLECNSEITVIVSGGMGSDERITEAQCMYDALLQINSSWSSRILLEEQASDTRENLQYSMALIENMGGTAQPVVLVTSEYHMARASYIAGTLGLDTAGITAVTEQPVLRFNYYLREVFSFVKAIAES